MSTGDDDNDDDNDVSCAFAPSTRSLGAPAALTSAGCAAAGGDAVAAAAGLERFCKSSHAVTSLVTTGEERAAPGAARSCCSCCWFPCRRGVVEPAPAHELTSSSLTSRSRTFASRLETWFSNAVMRSSVAAACAVSEEAGAAACGWVVPVMVVVRFSSSGEGTLLGLDAGMMTGKGVVVGARGPGTSVPDMVVSAVLAASPLGA